MKNNRLAKVCCFLAIYSMTSNTFLLTMTNDIVGLAMTLITGIPYLTDIIINQIKLIHAFI